jgi:hypothetical protein
MNVQVNLIQNQVINNDPAKSCLATKKLKVPTKWTFFLLWFIFFAFVNHNLFNFANGFPLEEHSRQKRVIFPKINEIEKTENQSTEKPTSLAGENFEIKFPGGGFINAKGIFSMGLISATAALIFVCDHFGKVVMCVIRRLNNTDGNQIELQMEDRRLVFFDGLSSSLS